METKDMIAETARMVNEMQGQKSLYFQTPVTVCLSPYNFPVNIWAVSVSPRGDLYLLGLDVPVWDNLEHTDINADKVAASLYQRVKMIFSNVPKPKYNHA